MLDQRLNKLKTIDWDFYRRAFNVLLDHVWRKYLLEKASPKQNAVLDLSPFRTNEKHTRANIN